MDSAPDAHHRRTPPAPITADRPTQNRRPKHTPLNARQQQYLLVFYELDQQAQDEQSRRWHHQLRRDPADQWRWIVYDTEHRAAGPSPAQLILAQRGIQDAGSGSTIAALARRGMIETRRVSVDSPTGAAIQVQVRLTRTGRTTARVVHPAPSTDNDERLPGWLDNALIAVAQAAPSGLPKTKIGRVAARRLGPQGHGYIEEANAWSYQLSSAGRAYLGQPNGQVCQGSDGATNK